MNECCQRPQMRACSEDSRPLDFQITRAGSGQTTRTTCKECQSRLENYGFDELRSTSVVCIYLPIAERHGDNLRLSWGMRWRVSTQLHLKRTIQISFWKYLWRVGKLSWQQKRQEFPIAIYVRLGPEEEEEEGGRKTWVWSDRRDGKHLFFNTMRAIRAKFLQGTGKTSYSRVGSIMSTCLI